MNARVEHLLDEALGLTPEERSTLVLALLASLKACEDPVISDAWRQEIRLRTNQLRDGIVHPVPWAEAKARLQAL